MTPSQQCKSAGLSGLKELIELSGKDKSTLIRWHNDQQNLFEIVVLGAVAKKKSKPE